MDLGLTGKRALVMGASRGIGRGIARILAAEGCELVTAAAVPNGRDSRPWNLSYPAGTVRACLAVRPVVT